MNLATFTTDGSLAAVSNRGSPFNLRDGNHQQMPPSSQPKVASAQGLPKVKRPGLGNRLRGAQVANRQVYQAQQVLTTVTEAMEQLEELLSQIEWTEQDSPVEDEIPPVGAGNLTGVMDQLVQAQQGVGKLQDQFEETTSDWMAHLPFSAIESNILVVREIEQAKEQQKWISQQIADNSRLAIEVQAGQISDQVLILLT